MGKPLFSLFSCVLLDRAYEQLRKQRRREPRLLEHGGAVRDDYVDARDDL